MSSPTKDGGKPEVKDVRDYQPPKGPTNVNDPKTPGIHGEDPCMCGTQGKH